MDDIETMYAGQVNSPTTELSAAINDTQTTIAVLNGAALPDAPNIATIGKDESAETIRYGSKTGNTLSGVVRGFQGTARSWGVGQPIARLYTAYDQSAAIANITEIDGRVTGIAGAGRTTETVKGNADAIAGVTAQLVDLAQDVNAVAPEVTVGKTIYVDVVSGNDTTGNGTSGTPYKTIKHDLSTLKKVMYEDVKVRILPGDYTAEGAVWVKDFSKQYLIITAFDGANDVTTPNDGYVLRKMSVDSCDKIMLQGLKIDWNGTSDYGIFTSNTRFGYYIGIKNDNNDAVNNGFGVTVNSEVYLENCLCSNKDIVVSCNFGSRVVSTRWSSGSVGNRIGLWAHGGSTITKSGTQPGYTMYAEYVDDGGQIIEEDGRNRSSQVLHSADAIATGVIDIPLNLPIAPSWIKIDALLNGTKEISWGQWSRNNGTPSQSCVFRNNADTMGAAYDIVQLNDGAGKIVQYSVTAADHNNIRLTITKTGLPTGSISLNVLAGC